MSSAPKSQVKTVTSKHTHFNSSKRPRARASGTEMMQDRHHGYGHAHGTGAPYGILLALVVCMVVVAPFLRGDPGEAITEAITELLSPLSLLLLSIILLLTIQFLSSAHGSFVSTIFSTGQPDTIHRVSGSPVGVALFLVLILFLLYNRVSIFGGDDESGD